jgi:AraC family transcriptional activator of mtrCDE
LYRADTAAACARKFETEANPICRSSRPKALRHAWIIEMESLDEPRILSDTVDRLLNTLEVRLHDCTLCSVAQGTHAKFDPVDAITVHYVLAGAGSLQTADNEIHSFGPQSVVIAPARVGQSWGGGSDFGATIPGQAQCGPVDGQWSRLLSNEPSEAHVRVIRSEITITNAGVPGFFDHLRAPILEDIAENSDAQQAFELLVKELARPGAGSQAVLEGLMKAFLILLLRRHLHRSDKIASSFTMMSDPRLARAMVHILERPADAHTVDTLAAAAGMSRTTFLERFRETYAQSPIEFLQGFRLKFATHLLKTTNLPVKSVAVAVGYSSRSYFSRIFSAAYAADPTAYRLEYRAETRSLQTRNLKPGF